jgi:hypothetical protein
MKKLVIVGFILILLLFIFIEFSIIRNQTQVTQNIIPSPTIASQQPVLGANSEKHKCNAIQVDPNDPEAFLPDKSCTPGSINPAVTQENIYQTICKSGYTKTVRPPVSYTNTLKKQQIEDYGYKDTDTGNYEEDHFISLELGGSPSDPKNLWPEPHPSFNKKDSVESYLHTQICTGKITLLQAQEEITGNWYEIYKQIR